MFTLNTLQLYRGGRSLRATEHSPLNAANGGAMDALLCNYMNSVCKVTSYCLGIAELKSPVFKEQKEWPDKKDRGLRAKAGPGRLENFILLSARFSANYLFSLHSTEEIKNYNKSLIHI